MGPLAGAAISAGMGLLLEGHNDRRQFEQQERLQGLQIQGQKQMTDYNYQKQLQMWRDTGYEAQMAQMREAGLNPALMYAKGGAGGMTVGSGGGANVSGGQAPAGGMEVMNMMAQQAQLQLMKAQTENVKAQTNKTTAETGAVQPGIEKTQQETINLKTQNILTELETAFQQNTFKNRESIINISLSKLIEEVRIIENNREISDATKNTQINLINQELINKVKQGLQIDMQNAKTEKESYYIQKQINALDQQININKPDEQMAKQGLNPKAGTMLKTGHSVINFIKNLLGL